MNDAPLSRLADVVLPPPPDWTAVYLAIAASIIVALALIIALRWRRRRTAPTRAAAANSPSAELKRIRVALQAGAMSEREAAYRLASILRLGLGLRQLPAHCPPEISQYREVWAASISALSQARYSSVNRPTLDPALLNYIDAWLHNAKSSPSC